MTEHGGSRYIAVAASVLLHAGALALVWQLPPSAQTLQQLQATPVQIVLLAPAENQVMPAGAASSPPLTLPAPTTAPEVAAPQPPSLGSDLSLHAESATGQVDGRRLSLDTASTAAAGTDPAAVSDETTARASATTAETARYTSGQVLASLEEAFAAHFYYPMLARRKGWEGEVTVGLRVETDGRLTGIHVVGSSGYLVLDNAAIDSLSRARALSLPGGVIGNSLEMVLPVQYRLLDARV